MKKKLIGSNLLDIKLDGLLKLGFYYAENMKLDESGRYFALPFMDLYNIVKYCRREKAVLLLENGHVYIKYPHDNRTNIYMMTSEEFINTTLMITNKVSELLFEEDETVTKH